MTCRSQEATRAADHLDNPCSRHRPRLPAAQKPGAGAVVSLNFGTAHVIYPQADNDRCTCALAVEIDPVALVRDRQGPESFSLSQYVNDRPYAASSLLSVAIAQVFGTALSGICKSKQDLWRHRDPARSDDRQCADARAG